MCITFLFIQVVLVHGQQSSQWIGTFKTDNSCDQSKCCCLNGTVTISEQDANNLELVAPLAGQCDSHKEIEVPLVKPAGYITTINFGGQTFDAQLTADNKTISIVYGMNNVCSVNAVRDSGQQLSQWIGTFKTDNSCDQNLSKFLII
ncbi:unnamed protein product [Didymodactylos carnosus]|uniref:Uncharacterized protein n=1 Tax=Didymodactylos carnosus TaxID=1234261 RepID=A0A814WYJ1_9BILA|nr:unnamed protein product [Didymodactylos carnosus]CAF1210635.1 unnamed protein product [Didymodactylos carnosus]CAF3633517.1 unnamed protein product [Didymodactylos carnosus]CAF3974663.1 unnamed protein product [Didymodactylos carnosus]